MAWEWSHSPEAYVNARNNLFRRSLKTLQVILAEWIAYEGDPLRGNSASSNLNLEKYKAELKRLREECRAGRLDGGSIAEEIWRRMEQLRTCDNGGFSAWCCPFGCRCHMVSFSTPSELMRAGKERKKARLEG